MAWLKRLVDRFRTWWNDPGPVPPFKRADDEEQPPFDPADDLSDRR
jgi:hypothetical protein